MQELFFENPIVLGIIGAATVGVGVIVWVQTGRKPILYVSIGLAVVSLLLVMINIQVRTDREKIRTILDEIAAALRMNDHEKVYSYIHPNALEIEQRAKREIPRYEFEEARVTGIREIEVNFSSTPPTAIAEFFARVKARRNTYKGTAVRFARVYFMLREERWLVRDYEHFEPTAGFRDNALTQPAF